MKPTSLDALIRRARGVGEVAVLAPGGGWSADMLAAAAVVEPLERAKAAGSVALCCHDPLRFLIALTALDGIAGRLLLLPDDLSPAMVSELAARSQVRAILTDRQDLADGETIHWTDPIDRALSSTPATPARTVATRWIFATSGTTGSPKLVDHDLSGLCTGVRTRPGEAWRWGQMYGPARFAGVQVMVQALAQGVLLLPDPDWPPARRLAFLKAEGCTAMSATPTLWRKILMTPASDGLALRQITLGGEIADGGVLAALQRRFPEARISHVYASTEAGASFAITDGLPGFPAAMLDRPGAGPALKLVDGRLLIRSARGRRTYVGSTAAYADDEGFVDTGDMVEQAGDRCLFRGRANGAINVGGDKLYPQEVEAVLLAHPDVAFARIHARSNPITGQIVIAEVVARDDAAHAGTLTRTLQTHCAQHLPRWKCPAAIRLVPQVAADASGKIGRTA
ncbi:fatty acid--CoA ligase family protein [uncultured Sphingomonas sp.]|uniref:ANL family adenylate-forming protein n=1 Tax=uncultured Sphingomonas sp. TaxID=158754 RepID=UPI0025F73878|nr:fatty acid--CoA ligase family protein [uncultured Sphingomonas sp.]